MIRGAKEVGPASSRSGVISLYRFRTSWKPKHGRSFKKGATVLSLVILSPNPNAGI